MVEIYKKNETYGSLIQDEFLMHQAYLLTVLEFAQLLGQSTKTTREEHNKDIYS